MPEPTNPAPRPATAAERQEELLRQLVTLTESVETLARRSALSTVDEPPPSATESPPVEVTRTRFAYAMLGELLGRTGFSVDRIDVRQEVNQDRKRTLTFTALKGGTVAHFHARDGKVGVVSDLVENQPFATEVSDDVPIDLVVLRKDDGTAVGLALCPPPTNSVP